MKLELIIAAAACLLVAVFANAQPVFPGPEATLTLHSDQDGMMIAAGSQVTWTITVQVEEGTNLGLAAVSVNLEQLAGNPSTFDIPPAMAVPTLMSNFSRPQGISNPVPNDPTASAYTGTLIGPAGARNLVQIGGMQNTFGVQGVHIGRSTTVQTTIGQQQSGGEVMIAQGSFAAPSTPGTYQFDLTHVMVNVLDPSNTSFVLRAAPDGVWHFSFLLGCCTNDFNGDGDPGTDADIEAFFACIGGNCCPTCASADFNCDGDVATDADIQAFFRVLGGGSC